MPSMPYKYPLYRCNLHFGLPATRRCGRIRIKSSAIQSNRKRAGKITLSLENAKHSGCLSIFLDEICTGLLYHTRRKPPFPYLGSTGQDGKSAGDVMGHKCAGLFDIAYWCVLYLRAQMQHTSEISTHIVRAHNMPCHHHQGTHQQETTHTPPKVPFKCHHNIRQIPHKHNITHACPNTTVAGVTLGHIHLRFAWQAWHLAASTLVLRGRRGTYGTGWRAWVGFSRRWHDQPLACGAFLSFGRQTLLVSDSVVVRFQKTHRHFVSNFPIWKWISNLNALFGWGISPVAM